MMEANTHVMPSLMAKGRRKSSTWMLSVKLNFINKKIMLYALSCLYLICFRSHLFWNNPSNSNSGRRNDFGKVCQKNVAIQDKTNLQWDYNVTFQFTLLCNVTGNPAPSIGWNVRGQIIRGGSEKYKVTKDGLVIFNITKEDQVYYFIIYLHLDSNC